MTFMQKLVCVVRDLLLFAFCMYNFTFMSFMMDWKSPPKALHSFSITASIFPRAEKKQLTKTQLSLYKGRFET